LDQSLIKLGFNRCVTEHAIYIRCDAGGRLIVRVYVDDLIITGANTDMVGKFKAKMQSVFKMSDLGPLSYYLGIEVHQSKQGITISQGAYAKKILEKA
jgi:ribosomal protein L6P/L9E